MDQQLITKTEKCISDLKSFEGKLLDVFKEH
jgi:hypothetical protein